ncbi:DEAD/DEAH box helicase [Aliihoeflea sp. 2WW]|uniref:DEAD/DEAH box helicase n=1 Tax=Aliihoeflea sp. 2WW TaxID=1381123 RepID=UPI000464F9EE|nr:DEAD/DEAH box helicase [Aliihoeflea sp. 2WW]
MTEFEGILPPLAAALEKRGYSSLTPVQKAVTGSELGDADALVSAQTGSGKTVAFGLALAPTLLGDDERFGPAAAPLALAIAPTRELALQVKRELEWLYAETGATVASCVGGMDMRTERRTLERGAQIVVGTPGRLRDHITRGSLQLDDIRAVVLDEADEMLDLGFREDLEFILEAAPDERRTLMFSATVSKPIAELAKNYQRNAVRISTAAEARQHGDIEYRALTVADADRENAIINVLRYYEPTNALVFCATRAAVNHMTARFNNRGFSVVALSGELSQNERTHALQAMRDGRAQVCIATDVAARGIDLPNLELVIHADLPTNRETLLHRSGRTGRAGRKGMSVLIVPNKAGKRASRLLQSASINAQWGKPPTAEEVVQRDDERLLADPALSEPITEDVEEFVRQILEKHGAEQVAAAYVRAYRAGRSAPEDLMEVNFVEDRKAAKEREPFGDAVWFSLSIGRKQNAEPRWLIPMLCRNGNLTKKDIGAIKMMPEETFVEIAAGSADRFAALIGKKGDLERGIRVKRVEGTPEFARDSKPAHRGQKPDQKFEKKDWSKKPGKPKFEKRPDGFKKKKPKREG